MCIYRYKAVHIFTCTSKNKLFGSQALFVLLWATTSWSVCDPLLWDRVNPELCSEGMQKRCAVRLRCTKSDIFSHLLQPQTIPAHKNYCHVPKIEDAPISRVKPLARLREARLQIRRQKRDSNSFRTTDGKKPLTARSVRQNRTDTGSTVPTPELISGSERCWYWYITHKLSNTSNTDM